MSVVRARVRFWLHAPVLPVAVAMGAHARRRMPSLPEAAGERGGAVAGDGAAFELAVLGESTAAGVGVGSQEEGLGFALARALRRHVRVQIAGESGATVARVHELVSSLAFPVDAVVVAIGVNDTLELTRGRTWTRRVAALVRDLRARGAREVVVSGLPPLGAFRSLPQPTRSAVGARADYLDALLRRTCAALDARYVALNLPPREEYLARDGFHPSAAGYARWAETIAATALTATAKAP
ncbi:MAG: SGNH/GDSL hydrolase family protein [Labilithrix sp.]|nr:SGNH/GDSL hydrolase family protein [Labilithrix sp.]MCW5812282.1 SGNH/GDSL hydrolase family protein [Labilithrix sp.]